MNYNKIIVGPENLETGTAQQLIDRCDEFNKVDLFFDGFGGFCDEMNILEKYLNSRRGDIDIYLQFGTYSAHSVLCFLRCENKVFVYPDFECTMFHFFDAEEYTRRKENTKYRKFSKIDFKNKVVENELKEFLPKKLVKKFSKGKDLKLSYKQVKKYFNKKENIFFI